MTVSARLLLATAPLTLALLASTASAAPVAPSRITPQSHRPPERRGTVIIAAPAQETPAGAEHLNFVVAKVAVEGGFSELQAATDALAATIKGRRISGAEAQQFASALEKIYAQAGYVLVRVTVPPQLNHHGTLKVIVTDGFIERVQADTVPEHIRGYIAARTASLIGAKHIKLDEIERVLLLGAMPGLLLKTTFAKGTEPGGTLLVLEGTYRPVTGGVTLDNHLPEKLGTWSYGGDAVFNSLFGFGELVYVFAQSAGDPELIFDDESPFRVLGAGAVVPLGWDGWILNPEYTTSRTQEDLGPSAIEVIGEYERFALRTSYPILRTVEKTFSVSAAFEDVRESVEAPLFDIEVYEDHYHVLRTGLSYEGVLPWAGTTLQSSIIFSQGIGGRDPAAGEIPLSRQGADAVFSKLGVDAHFTHPLSWGWRLDAIGRGQSSFGEPLLSAEQFSLDGKDALSAFDSGALSVDEGGTLRVVLSHPFVMPKLALTLAPYVFGAYGIGRLNEPTILEIATLRAGSAGVGVEAFASLPGGYSAATFGLEIARQYDNAPNAEEDWRAQFHAGFTF